MNRRVDVKSLVSHIVRGDGIDRCRICMGDTTEGQVFLGDTVMLDGERPITLAELLESLTGIKVVDECLCPRGVCFACVGSAVAAQDFRSLVDSSYRLWQNALTSLDKFPSNVSPPIKSLCAYITGESLEIHIVKDYSKDESHSVIDRLKPKLIKSATKSRKPLPSNIRKRLQRTGPTCDCGDCGKQFSNPLQLNLHLKNSGQKEACVYCGQIYFRGQDLRSHLEVDHGENWRLCNDCPLIFSTETDLKLHRKKAHAPGVLTCGDCGRSFTRTASFEAHTQMHAVRTCRTCGAQFTNRGCYREHRSHCEPDAKPSVKLLTRNQRANIRDPATFICDYCRKVYTSRPQLKNHIIWIHMDVRPHQCQWCGKRFYTSARLSEHNIVHTRERKFACDICGVKLVSKMAAVYHRRRHTGEKPYKCDDCGDRFISASRRSEHAKRRHGKGARMQCSQCVASFVRGHELRKHVEKVHKGLILEIDL